MFFFLSLPLQVERGKPKCAKYWPDLDKTDTFGKFTVNTTMETTLKDYTLREFVVSKEGEKEERKIVHFHFQVMTLSWLSIVSMQYIYIACCCPLGLARPWRGERTWLRSELSSRRERDARVFAQVRPDHCPLLGRDWEDGHVHRHRHDHRSNQEAGTGVWNWYSEDSSNGKS